MTFQTPEFLQTKTYTASKFRGVWLDGLKSQGVVDQAQLVTTQHAAGANLSVDVSAGSAFVKGGYTARQGMYHAYNDALLNMAVATASGAANPRIDGVWLRVEDSTDGGSPGNTAYLEIRQGTPTSSAQNTDPSQLGWNLGLNLLPVNTTGLLLATIAMPAGATSVLQSYITDMRPYALGGSWTMGPTAGQTISTAWQQIGPGPYFINCSGRPLFLNAFWSARSTGVGTAGRVSIRWRLDAGASAMMQANDQIADNGYACPSLTHIYTPTAGRHRIDLEVQGAAFGNVIDVGGCFGTIVEL